MKEKASPKIGYMKLTGTLNIISEKKRKNPWTLMIRELNKGIRYKGQRGGYYCFTHGFIQPLHEKRNNDSTELLIEFKSARLSFLDRMVNASLHIAEKCGLTFSIREIPVDFNALREMGGLKEEDFSEINEFDNFETPLSFDDVQLRIAAYPKVSMINILAKFTKESLDPSKIVRILLKKVGKSLLFQR